LAKCKYDNIRRRHFKPFSINTSLVSDNLRNQQHKIGSSALNALMITGFGLAFLGFIILIYLAVGHMIDQDE
jgi:hypothetical protein